ncbi:3-[(3aS,4S,7aS)-7a-methyl-1,5-dioxo-octahydro-1H-inden-4-yl]propanoyl:CoA ligase [BD1-7 clade bacterium]|uniref:3-[(3aS,4S,7aS)-7a-methyl-1,5-dioxo-octahydro-1H-inden-4-yl]propanoyl:CoA ligase n=1 Tax=BD1-7 clade bacterium TaxID=2029982 RepID=A0A5S9PLR1_9GAMM|nr:3-[(3aS,4S,7aS)-7a-methyl-1,5-dioxo-octahydro-1H-inden-4-yl]propanoyl:CoA ligase [BD1-7 clade bacterium]CAA0105027.1 3-[(3aS,4S,7aS)-7a-methyl-1,5-dioxo-octahydro-1H-inden-4-yl]propanoyl:CoA ligase [BD1-7 clade bacterium]
MMNAAADAQTLPLIMTQAAVTYGDKVAIKEGDNEITYAQLNDLRWQAAKAFVASGIEKGDRIAVWAPNVSPWIIASLGLESIGAVLVPLNTRMKGSEAADLINRSGAKMVFTLDTFQSGPKSVINYLDMLKQQDLPGCKEIVLFENAADGATSWDAFLTRGDNVEQSAVEAMAASVSPDDTMDMLFTSGTTGKPKGVMCAHGQNIRTITTWADTNGLNDSDNYLIINPFFHSFGYKAGWLAAIIKGARMFPVLTFDLDAVLQQIHDDQITMLPGPPTIYQSILAHPRRAEYDLSSLRLAVTGAAPVPVELVNRMRNELNFETVVTAYGLTETCGFVSICRPDDPAEIISGSSGRAMDGIEVKIVDGQGDNMPEGEAGEIWVRGYNVMKGYFDNDQATEETITADGWLKTGDVGTMDANGYIDITDRMKDMYISGGFNVYPAEIESAICNIDGVVQAAVVGVADERMGEVGKVFVVKKADSTLTEQDVVGYCKTNIANYKVPRFVEFLDAMPMNASGKILKTELRSA